MMAVVEQCPRESQALHPDYYRTRKKTRFHLNELFTSRPRACLRKATHDIHFRVVRLAALDAHSRYNKQRIAETCMK
jgi:hypothetical protein